MNLQPDDNSDDKKIVEYVRNKVEEIRASSMRITYESTWMTNTAYLLGYQVFWDSNTRQFRSADRAEPYMKKNRIQINKILPRVQNRLARLSKSRPKFIVKPETNEADDKDAARFSEQLLTMLWEKNEMDVKYLELLMSLQQSGHAYLKVSWDDQLGGEIFDPETGEMDYEGDIRVDVVSAFEVYTDPLAKSLAEAQYVIQAKVRKLDYFRSHYPKNGSQVKEEGAWLLSTQFENRINTMSQNTSGTMTPSMMMDNAAIELAYYEKRSRKHPNGRMIITANGVLLKDEELPCGEIPFIKFDDVLIAGKYYSDSLITHARPIQDQFNRLYSKRAQWTNKLLAGKYLAPRGSALDSEGMNDQSGEVVYFNPVPNGPVPQAMNLPVIPQYAYAEEQSLERQMDDIFGINDVSRGESPGGGQSAWSAIALQYLSEQDDTRIGVVSRRIEKCMALFAKLMLEYAQKYYITPRKLKVAGEDRAYMVRDFTGADIKGNTDVTVMEGSALPGSVTAKRDFILTLYNQGLLGDPADSKVRERVLKMIEFGSVSEIWQDQSLNEAQIKRGIELIKKGELPIVDEMDAHDEWIKALNNFRKTPEFEQAPVEVQAALLKCREAHLQWITEISNPQIPDEQLPHPEILDMPPPEMIGGVPEQPLPLDINPLPVTQGGV